MISAQRIYQIYQTRTRELLRDRGAMAWNIVFPLVLVMGIYYAIDSRTDMPVRVGIMAPLEHHTWVQQFDSKVIEVRGNSPRSIFKEHSLNLLVNPSANKYWVPNLSKQSLLAENKLLHHVQLNSQESHALPWKRVELFEQEDIPYIEWLIPGVLALNLMFNCLFGVGFILVRYRHSGILTRFLATPLSKTELVLGLALSRLSVTMFATIVIYALSKWLIGFDMHGSYLNLLIIAITGSFSLISLGLLCAARTHSEEVAGGILNLVSWPMMMLSGAWFTWHEAPSFLNSIVSYLPLNAILEATRAVMLNGADFFQILPQLSLLLVSGGLFVLLTSVLFRWGDE